MNILITSVSNKVLLVEAFKNALATQSPEGKVIGIDTDKYSAALYFCDDYMISPRLDREDFFDFIVDLCCTHKIDLIVPTRDQDVMFFSQHGSALLKKHDMTILTPTLGTVEVCEDKYLFYKFLEEQKIPTIKSWNTISDKVRFPCVLKKMRGAGTELLLKIHHREKLEEEFSKTDNLIIQEYIEGTEYTIDYFSDLNAVPVSIVPRIRYKVVNGESKVGITVDDPELVLLSKKLGKALGLIGHNIIQCFRTQTNEIKILEVNPRYGGGSNLSFAAGANTPEFLLQLLVNKPVSYSGYKSNLTMIRYSKDIFIEDDKADIV